MLSFLVGALESVPEKICIYRMSFVYNPFSLNDIRPLIQVEYEIVVSHTSMQFRVKLTPDIISVGGQTKNCVQITVKSKEIAWVKSSVEGECELNKKPVGGQDTIHMIHIALWFLKNGYKGIHYPVLTELELTDSSKFQCSMPDGSERSMSMLHRDALIHGMSFYERKLGAEPRFNAGKEAMNILREKRKTKQPYFDFRNADLNVQLRPLYDQSTSWENFMKNLVKVYGSVHVCQIMHPWYLQAVTDITEGVELPTRWILRNLTPAIEPKILRNFSGGSIGGDVEERPFHEGWDIYTMPYTHLQQKRRKKTRRTSHRGS